MLNTSVNLRNLSKTFRSANKTRPNHALILSQRSQHNDARLLIDHIKIAAKKFQSEPNSQATPIKVYDYLIQEKILKPDSHQKEVINDLEKLFHRVLEQKYPKMASEIGHEGSGNSRSSFGNSASNSGGFFKRLFAPPESSIKQVDLVYGMQQTGHKSSHMQLINPAITGLYLHGSVGCGKTMMMDMFYSCLELDKSISGKGIRRIHFNQFMLDVHKRLHSIKKSVQVTKNEEGVTRRAQYENDVIPILADQLISLGWVLCFDEFQVTDIADAMMLKRLFSELWKRGVVVVITGNRKPDDLYKNGLQYQNFQPFLPLLKQHTEDVLINSGIDYRRMELSRFGDTFILKSERNCEEKFEKLLFEITGLTSFDQMSEKVLTVFGRKFKVEKSFKRIAMFDFDELCSRPLGAQDYLEIASSFDCIFIRDLPQIDLQTQRAEARRFITLIDNLYDCKTGVAFLAEAHDENIFTVKDDRHLGDWTAEERQFMDDLKIAGTEAASALSVLSGEDEAFAMARLLSRLSEMKTQDYFDDVRRRIKKNSLVEG